MSMQQFSEEPTPVYTAPPPAAEVVETPPETTNAPRYDAQTVQTVIALAQEMQAQHRESLTPDEIEGLGHEVGVAPEFVRRALKHVEAQKMQPVPVGSTAHTRRKTEVSRRSLSRLTRRQKAQAVVPAALYFLIMLCTFGLVSRNDSQMQINLYAILPAFLAFGVGAKVKSLRVSVLSGTLFGVAGISGALASSAYQGETLPTLGLFALLLGLWVGVGVLLSVVATGTRRFLFEEPGRRLRVIWEDGTEDNSRSNRDKSDADKSDADTQSGEWV